MRLYFMRHALAEDLTDKITDAQRKLTDRGIASTQQAARAIKALGIKPNRFYTSPLTSRPPDGGYRRQSAWHHAGSARGTWPRV